MLQDQSCEYFEKNNITRQLPMEAGHCRASKILEMHCLIFITFDPWSITYVTEIQRWKL